VGLAEAHIFSDFDGTISTLDSLKALLSEFGGQKWRDLEAGILTGRIPERVALPEMFRDFSLSLNEAQNFVLENIKIDPTFVDFVEWCEESSIDLTILSGGFHALIRPLLDRVDLGHLKVIANEAYQGDRGWIVQEVSGPRLCSLCSHCKCGSLQGESLNRPLTVYVGDGHTDFCVSQKADRIYAKSHLQRFLTERNWPFQAFVDFADVQLSLESAIADRRRAA